MSKARNHYENLKVSRNAPPEVIRAAYKTLSQKYHPDRNPGDENSELVMQIINRAYEVLSDPDKKRRHDDWIERMDSEEPRPKANKKTAAEDESGPKSVKPRKDPRCSIKFHDYLKKYNVTKSALDAALDQGSIRGQIFDGDLYVEDREPLLSGSGNKITLWVIVVAVLFGTLIYFESPLLSRHSRAGV